MSNGYVHGSSDAREVARLEKQARFCSRWILPSFEVPEGARVLDLATGVAAMAGQLRFRWPEAKLCGVDLSAAQLSWARKNHPEVPVARGDASHLPFADATFERVHCSWLLEHVPHPVPILREVRRVLKPGGWCLFTEVDNGTLETQPASAAVREVMDALNHAQLRAGGDPYIGRRLVGMFRDAGFTRIESLDKVIRGYGGEPEFFQGFVDEFAEIFEGLDESLPHLRARQAQAAVDLRALPGLHGEMRYRPTMVRAFK